MNSLKTFDCMCCGKVYPLKYIYVSSEIPSICDDCISKIKEAYEAYLKDDALDELECLLKWFNTPTETKVTIRSMKAIYEGLASPLLDEDKLLMDEEHVELNRDEIEAAILNNDIKSSIVRAAQVPDPSSYIDPTISVYCSSHDYQMIAHEAAKLMRARKNRPMRTAITMAWKKYAIQKLKELKTNASRILIERPDDYTMSIVVEDILENGKLDQIQE